MGSKEKFGKLVLLEEIESTGMGAEYRAAKLGPAGLEKIVTVLRLQPAISTHAEIARALMDQAKLAAQLQNPNVLKIFGIGKVDQSYYISYEHVEGRSLSAILRRCRQESFPFSVEHALLVVSKVCSVLEYAQGRRSEGGGRYYHGLLTPACVLVSYEGEVRVKGFGYWPSRVVETGALGPDDRRYLAPEQAAGNGDYRSDIYSVGAILLETLTGRPPEPGADLLAQVPAARLASPAGDDDSLPPSLAEVFRRALDRDPAARYPEAAEMRKAIDTLLFSGDFTPTTFNLAFFMHSLYREEIEKESRALKQEREASYLEYLGEEAAHPAAPAPPPVVPVPSPRPAPPAAGGARADSTEARPPGRGETAPAAEVTAPPPAAPAPHDSSPGLGARAPATSFTFHKKTRAPNRLPLLIGAAAVVAAGVGAAWYFLGRPAPPPPPPVQAAPPSPSAEALAAQARVKELEEKLAALEAEKAAAEAKAAEEAKKRMEAQAKARGQVVDPAALQKAQEEARRRAKEEQERKQQEELRRIEEERKAEEARLAEERRRAEEQAKAAQLAAAAAAAPPSTPTPSPATVATPTPVAETPPPTPAAVALRPGTLVNINDPGVIPPVLERAPTLVYPPIALRQRIEGVVELNVLVDEKGTVRDAQVVSRVEGKAGLNEAAIDNVKRRRYRPAAKEGVPVKVWVSVRVVFELPK
jgi:TonB family protein